MLEKLKDQNQKYHYFTFLPETLEKASEGVLNGIYFSVKDCVCVKDMPAHSSSKILTGYVPPYDATVIKRLKENGGVILGKTIQDEFGFGSFTMNTGVGFPIPINPLDENRTTGGSSGGGVAFSKLADFPHVAIVESTGGSIESPAAYCGVIGFCPTYGRLSRYGLLSYANSFDKIGFSGTDLNLIKQTYKITAGFDPMDSTSLKEPVTVDTEKRSLKIGLIKDALNVDPEVKEAFMKRVEQLKQKGHIVEEVSLPITFKYGLSAYYILVTSEASTNLAKYCGLRYGVQESPKFKTFDEYFTKIRSENFGTEAKRRIILGTFARMTGYRDAYYIKAAKVRTLIIEEYKKLFEDYDLIISPTMPTVAPTFDEIKQMTTLQQYMSDVLTVGPNLAGVPHITLPINTSLGLPAGFMACSKQLDEATLFMFAENFDGVNLE